MAKRLYTPLHRYKHKSILVGGKICMWGGQIVGLPEVHSSQEKQDLLSRVDVFEVEAGGWIQQPIVTSGTPPLGVVDYACAAVGDNLYYFGGLCPHDVNDCFQNSMHELSTSSGQWVMLSPTVYESDRTTDTVPMRKICCEMVAFRDGEEDVLFVVGGLGIRNEMSQPGTLYELVKDTDLQVRCNEQHLFKLSTREWSSPNVIGQPPPPCSSFTLTSVDENRAALFGGRSYGSGVASNDLLMVELISNTVHWIWINKPAESTGLFSTPVNWPSKRYGHAAAFVCNSFLLIMGREESAFRMPICDFWMYDLTKMTWVKVLLTDPSYNTISWRQWHSLSAIQISPYHVLLIVIGGLPLYSLNRTNTAFNEIYQISKDQWVASLVDRKRYMALSESRQRGQLHLQQGRREEKIQMHDSRNQQLVRENQQLVREKEEVTRENYRIHEELQQVQLASDIANVLQQQLTRENEQLRATNARGQEEILLLREQLSVLEPHWVVRKEEVEMTEEVIGNGAWGEVRVAKFRSLRVAAKQLHQLIQSDFNELLFNREMSIAAKVRHPNLLLFIGATREGEASVILTELMPISLRGELKSRELPRAHITSISQDVACALCYLHQWQPSPIIHRDISSGNVLLEPLSSGWRAKVSDYGSANFMNADATAGPGCPLYAAPEAGYPDQHSPKMDTYSYGVLLIEMCLRQLSSPGQREAQILCIQWVAMATLIRRCTSDRAPDRPNMSDIIELLSDIVV